MSGNLREWCVAVLAAALLAAAVVPWVTPTADAAQSASFEKRVVREQTGDVANITVHADAPATVDIGSQESGFLLRVQVGKGTTRLRLNTYKAGVADQYSLSEMVWAAKGNIRGRTLVTEPIEAPLDPFQYSMSVSINGDERDLATLWVSERTTTGMTARIAPRSTTVSELSTGAGVMDASLPPWNGSVARDDWVLLHVNASGVEGALTESRLDGDDGIMRLEFVQTNPPMNGRANEFTGADVRRVFTDPNTEGFYVVVDTGDHDIEADDRYRISFVIPSDSPLADSRQEVSTHIRVVGREISLQRKGPGPHVVVDGQTTISGRTTLTPGTTVNITARGSGVPPLFEHHEVEVGRDRRFSATFDFSGYERGREFEFRFRDLNPEKTVPAVVEGVVTTTEETTTTTRKPTTTTTPPSTTTPPTTTTPPPTTTNPPQTTTTPPQTATNTTGATATTDPTADGLTQAPENPTVEAVTQRTVRGETTNGGGGGGPVPGFGPVAVVVALAAGLVLAVRRL